MRKKVSYSQKIKMLKPFGLSYVPNSVKNLTPHMKGAITKAYNRVASLVGSSKIYRPRSKQGAKKASTVTVAPKSWKVKLLPVPPSAKKIKIKDRKIEYQIGETKVEFATINEVKTSLKDQPNKLYSLKVGRYEMHSSHDNIQTLKAEIGALEEKYTDHDDWLLGANIYTISPTNTRADISGTRGYLRKSTIARSRKLAK